MIRSYLEVAMPFLDTSTLAQQGLVYLEEVSEALRLAFALFVIDMLLYSLN